jgi:transposase
MNIITRYKYALELSKKGCSYSEISKRTNTPYTTVTHWIKDGYKPWKAKSEEEKRAYSEFLKKISPRGKDHWLFGKRGRQTPTFGLKRSEETKRKLSASKIGEKNPMWKGDEATLLAGRNRAERKFGTKTGLDIHHVDGNPLNNDPTNILFLSRREHMMMDGRLYNRDEKGRFIGGKIS